MSEQTLEQRLRAAEQAKQGQYDKRTEHLDADGNGVFINRLILEDSPYLLQHAHNPVNWFAWGEEAFEVAKAEDKPVFLSIGYSTCHWCHVMEVESFDNVEVAKLLNAHFISVKMDREQYPDLDEIYMTGVQLMTGQGGWPMSNFLLPDGRPFFGATYFPPPSFIDVLTRVHQAWLSQRDDLERSAASIDAAIARLLVNQSAEIELAEDVVQKVALDLLNRQDLSFGGLAGAPKFPQEPLLMFLLDYAWRERDSRCLNMVVNALRAMAMGGIYDQVGGGFHRYSVDELWLVPHFEKMLYNQSQLGQLYLDGWLASGDAFFRRILQQTLDYVLREMQLPAPERGGFYSATDADSEGEEGTFFVWSRQELVDALSAEQFALAERVFEISEQGNFEGNNILKLRHSLGHLQSESDSTDFLAELDALLSRLYELRERREPPLRDDKLIVAWNGAMINTLAQAGWQCGEAAWLDAAERAAESILANNLRDDGSLWRIALNGTCSIAGQLEDYANLIQGLITLFDVTGQRHYLDRAAALAERVSKEFSSAEQDVLYLSPAQQEGPQLVRSTNASDGATLSPVATMLENYLRLEARAGLLAQGEALAFGSFARRVLARQAGAVNEQAISHTSLLRVAQQTQQAVYRGIAYAGQGLLRIEAMPGSEAEAEAESEAEEKANTLRLRLCLEPGWHLSLQPPQGGRQLPEIAVSEQDSVWKLVDVERPASNAVVKLSDDAEVPAYGGEIEFELQLQREAATQPFCGSVQVEITVQLCTEGRCLLPETLQLLARVPG